MVCALVIAAACTSTQDTDAPSTPTAPDFLVERLGGTTSAREFRGRPFHQSARSLTNDEFAEFGRGAVVFDAHYAEASGLGPFYNQDSCLSCHLDGDTEVDTPDGLSGPGLLLRLSVPGTTDTGEPRGDPVYGSQLQDDSNGDVAPEGRIVISWVPLDGRYPDGTEYRLRRPDFDVADLAAGPLADDVMMSGRVAPPIIGMGLLEAIPESDLRQAADPDDDDGDGISGRLNTVWDTLAGREAIGRFGWKAGQPTVRQQSVVALHHDMGMTSPDLLEPCNGQGSYCTDLLGADVQVKPPELDANEMAEQIFYNRTIAVPIARSVDEPSVIAGANTFVEVGCAACHSTTATTGRDQVKGLSNQKIHPFTDLLLHDMGDGLADNRPEFDASGSEWRTPPLWGLSRRAATTGFAEYLHDGRARSYEEAILWHGGEGESSRRMFMELSAERRQELLDFLDAI